MSPFTGRNGSAKSSMTRLSPGAEWRRSIAHLAGRHRRTTGSRLAITRRDWGTHRPRINEFDMCRLLANMENWSGLEARMREIISDLAVERELDTIFLEDDWLQGIPKGAIDVSLVAQYQRLVAAPPNRRGGHWDVQK